MRPAGPGHGLRHGCLALPGEQARRRGQVYRPAGQDDHEPLHPLHAVRPLHHRSRRHLRARPDRAGRGCRDHDLSRARHDVGASGQRHRPVPRGCLDLQALRLPGAAVGTRQDGIDRRDGRLRIGHTGRHPRARGDAHHAAGQRGGERGVDLRQDALHLGRPEDPAPRQALCQGRRTFPACKLGTGLRRDRRCGEVDDARPDRSHCRRPRRGGGDLRAEGADGVAGFGKYRLPAGRFGRRSGVRPRVLSSSIRRSRESKTPTHC